MRRPLVLGAIPLAAGLALSSVQAQPRGLAATGFTRFANSPAGRALMETAPYEVVAGPAPGGEAWHDTGQDLLPFYYEQGVALVPAVGTPPAPGLVFSSRSSLTRTTLGCPAALDPGSPCYDVQAENSFAIPREERLQGFDHIGDIDAGRAGPAAGHVFVALEKPSGQRNARGYLAYDAETLAVAAKLIETIPHGFHSWVTVDPTGGWLIAADRGLDPIRVHEIGRDAAGKVTITRREALDVEMLTPGLPNPAGCAFDPAAAGTVLYCNDWASMSLNRDVRTDVYRIDLSAPLGSAAITATARLAFTLKLSPKYVVTANTPYGLETEGLTFYERDGRLEMHMLLRGETLGWFHYLHLAPGPAPG